MSLINLDEFQSDRISFFVLLTENITDEYINWLNDPAVNQFLESRYQIQDKKSVEQYVAACLANNDILLGIWCKKNERHIGNIRVHSFNIRHKTAEVGILIGDKSVWGKGYATESLLLLNKLCSRNTEIRKLTAGCYGKNQGSRKAFLKAGYTEEGIRKEQFLTDDGLEDLVLFGKIID